MIILSIVFLILAIAAHSARDAVLFWIGYGDNIFPNRPFWYEHNRPYQNDACHWFEKAMWLLIGCAWLSLLKALVSFSWPMFFMGLVFWAVVVFVMHELFLHGVFTKRVK